MSFASESCIQSTGRVCPLTARGRRVFREDAHVDYYGAHRRSICRHTRTRASKASRAGSGVVTKHANQRFGPCGQRKEHARGVEVGVSGREGVPSVDRERGSSFDNNQFFVRQFRYKPQTRPSVKSAAPSTVATVFKELREVDSLLEGVVLDSSLENCASEPATGSDAHTYSAAFYEKPKGASGKRGAKTGKRKPKSNPGVAVASLSSSSSSESSSSDDGTCQPKRDPLRTNGRDSAQLENSAVPAPPTLRSNRCSGRGEQTPMESGNTVFVCQGKGCSKRGGIEVLDAVSKLGNQKGFEVVGSKCMGRCKFGPVMVSNCGSNLEGVEHTKVDPATVSELLTRSCSAEKVVPSL